MLRLKIHSHVENHFNQTQETITRPSLGFNGIRIHFRKISFKLV